MVVAVLLAVIGIYLLLRSPGATPPPAYALPPAQTSRPAQTPPPASPLPTFRNTTNGIHLGIAFDYWVTNPATLQGKVDYVWGSRSPAANTAHHDAYMPQELDYHRLSGKTSLGPNHDLAWWQAHHPSAVVYTCDSSGRPTRVPAYFRQNSGVVDPNVPLDITNSFVRSYQAQRANQLLARGYQGISWDDFSLINRDRRCGVYEGAPGDPWANWHYLGYPALPNQTNAKLQLDMLTWLRYIHNQIKAVHPSKTITLNSSVATNGVASQLDLYTRQFLAYFDIDFDEPGFTDVSETRETIHDQRWKNEVRGINLLNAYHKAIDINAYVLHEPVGSAAEHAEANWVLANYLLVKGAHTYTYMQGLRATTQCRGRCLVDLPEYRVPIGRPTSPSPSPVATDTVYRRTYTGGEVLVNPSGRSTFTVALGGVYRDMYGQRMSAVTLPPSTGIVLLKASA
jgi:Hypothetical glycosyl hydrolase family 15